jgi:type IV secretory pathway VirB2 component (pilin)
MGKPFILTSNLQSSLNQATGDITNLLQGIGVGVLVVFIVILGIKVVTGGREGLREAKGSVVGLIIGAVLIWGAGSLAEWLQQISNF